MHGPDAAADFQDGPAFHPQACKLPDERARRSAGPPAPVAAKLVLRLLVVEHLLDPGALRAWHLAIQYDLR